MKILILVFSILVLSFANPVFAADETINFETGSNSQNTTSTFKEVIIKNINTNTVDVNNTVVAEVNTGGNSASFNTGTGTNNDFPAEENGIGGGSIETGNAKLSVVIKNNVNRNETGILPEPEELKPEPEDPPAIGGGEEVLQPAPIGGGGDVLPSAGPEDIDKMAALLGLPLIGVMLIRIFEILKNKSLA